MGYFSSDRSIQDYSEKIWKLQPVEVPKPVLDPSKHVKSSSNLKKLEKVPSKQGLRRSLTGESSF
jgi:hypothetical protein